MKKKGVTTFIFFLKKKIKYIFPPYAKTNSLFFLTSGGWCKQHRRSLRFGTDIMTTTNTDPESKVTQEEAYAKVKRHTISKLEYYDFVDLLNMIYRAENEPSRDVIVPHESTGKWFFDLMERKGYVNKDNSGLFVDALTMIKEFDLAFEWNEYRFTHDPNVRKTPYDGVPPIIKERPRRWRRRW